MSNEPTAANPPPKKVKKITSLTPEQTAQFDGWAKKWIDIGLSTEPADLDKAVEAALKAYDWAKLERPKIILKMQSPYAAVLGGALSWAMLNEMPKFKKELVSKYKAWEKENKANISNEKKDEIWNTLWDEYEARVKPDVISKVGSQAIYNSYHGSFWAGWVAYVSFFRDVCGWDDPLLERFQVDEDLVRNCGWVWWHEDILAVSDRPYCINRDEQGRLHCETGPSIAYRDDWKLYHWHGTAIQAEWIEDKANLQVSTVLATVNAEERRAGCELLGWAKVIESLPNSQVIDEDPDPEIGKVIRGDLPDAPGEQFLFVKCGTNRQFAIPIPPTIKTALEAQAWIYGYDDPKDFIPPEIRT